MILGHESAGIITKVGEGVRGLQIGTQSGSLVLFFVFFCMYIMFLILFIELNPSISDQ